VDPGEAEHLRDRVALTEGRLTRKDKPPHAA
jgi:hypothetical protein